MTNTAEVASLSFLGLIFLSLGGVLLLELVIPSCDHCLAALFFRVVNTGTYHKPNNMEDESEVASHVISLAVSSLAVSESCPSAAAPPVSLLVSSPDKPFSDEAGNSKSYNRGDPWFEDGNIVLVAEQTSFKVHRGVLAKHSDVFQGLLGIPQPIDAEKLEGLPVIMMADNSDDLSVLLTALYDGPR